MKSVGPIGEYSTQPITSAFRSRAGTMYLASDGAGATSLLWASRDNGKTWFDTGGRTGGRHTSFVLLRTGCILGMGGKGTNIDGDMPQSLSCNWGQSWQISKSIFPALASNQRPTIIRLASGRLFFASDYQTLGGKTPPAVHDRGAFVALSDDEGRTWHVKTLRDALPHREHKYQTLGYAVARQAPDGIIHLITSLNAQAMHFSMNEAWILQKDGMVPMPVVPQTRSIKKSRIIRAAECEPEFLRRFVGMASMF